MGCLFKKTNLVFLKRQMLGGCTLEYLRVFGLCRAPSAQRSF